MLDLSHYSAVSGSVLLVTAGIASGLTAFVFSLLSAPCLIWIAPKVGLIDTPDGHRKLQSQGIPLVGGVTIILSMGLTLLVSIMLAPGIWRAIQNHSVLMAGISTAAGLIALIGVIDDWLEIRGRQKLMGQIAAVGIVAVSGLSITRLSLLGHEIELGLLAVPFTMVWLIAAINAVNLIDGVDGLAGTVSFIVATTIAMFASGTNHYLEAQLAWMLAGAVTGFLYYNWRPARMYLGDAGSMTIGLILGVLAIRVSLKGTTTAGLAFPLVIWSVMFFDVAMAILRRQLTGQSIYATDRAHFHHVLLRKGYSISQVVAVIGGASFACCFGALLSFWLGYEWISILNATLILSFIVLSGLFGRNEIALFVRRMTRFILSLCRIPGYKPATVIPLASRFHGHCEWESLWQELVQYAERFDMTMLQLNISAPVIGEEYHVQWHRKQCSSQREMWRTEIPLTAGSISVGRLILCGRKGNQAGVDFFIDAIEGLKPFQIQLESLLLDLLPERLASSSASSSRPSVYHNVLAETEH